MSTKARIKAVVPEPMWETARRHAPRPVWDAKARWLDRRVGRTFGITPREFARYRAELRALAPIIARAHDKWRADAGDAALRGHPQVFGGISSGERLYAILRHTAPQIVVETGVCNGVSTAVVLLALHHNRQGRLASIDLPEFTDGSAPGEMWEGKLGATIPAGKEPGWLIPDHLRDRWELTIGRSQDLLEPLLDRVGPIDVFIHDSEHSYDCMTFEFAAAHRHLKPRGLMVSDDATWTPAFAEFAARQHRPVMDLDGGMHMIQISG